LSLAGLYGESSRIKFYIPITFMNICGKNVKLCLNKLKIKTTEICVFHDDLEIKKGTFVYSKPGSSFWGHNGLKSISSSMNNANDFYRIKLGIGRPKSHEPEDVAKYCLQKFTKEE